MSSKQMSPCLRFSHWIIYFLTGKAITIFYRRLEVRGTGNLPTTGPVIFVLNHPNGLIDALVLMMGLKWPVTFLAKSTLFGNPLGKQLMTAFGALPIYRQRDEGLPGGPQGDAAARNKETFARCRQRLHKGGAVALFPEGTTHSQSQLLPLKTGAARIALSTAAEADWQTELTIVPVGLWYENKALFRTSVLLVIGQPINVTDNLLDYAKDDYQTVLNLTNQIEAGLNEVVLQAENDELLAGIPFIAAWTAPAGQTLTLPQQHHWAAKLLTAYQRWHQTDAQRLEELADQARHYASNLYNLGISNPWALELPTANHSRLLKLMLGLLITFPVAMWGVLMSYLPYRLAAPLAALVVGQDDTQISTVKFIGGASLMGLFWLAEAILVSWWLNTGAGLLLLMLAPWLAYMALRWHEAREEMSQLVAGWWLRWRHQERVQALVKQRQQLAAQVIQAVETALPNETDPIR